MLKIAAMLDMGDESGRRRLLQAVRRILCQTLDENGDSIVPDAIALLAVLERSPVNFWKSLGEFVCQVGPDGAPFPALRRALHIIASGCRHTPRGRLVQHFPHHEQFLESHVLPLIACEDASCRASAVGALGSMGIVDAGIATNFLSLLAAPALLDETNVRVAAIKALFDIVLSHSLIPFAALGADAVEPSILECVTMPPGLNTLNAGNVILRVLFPLVEVEDASVRCVACEGFAKLLACGRFDDAAVLRHLLLQQFMPATKDDIAVRQCLSVFFPAFVASGTERAMMIARELVPTLRLVEAAPAGSSMAEVQSQQLIGYVLTLLDPSAFATPDGSSGIYEPHQEIALCALRECLCNGVSQSFLKVLLKLISVRTIFRSQIASWRDSLTKPQSVHFGPDQPHQVKVMYSMMDELASVVTDGASVKAVDKIAGLVASSAGSKAPDAKGAQSAWEKQRNSMLQV
jgi:condensin complex subunit 3